MARPDTMIHHSTDTRGPYRSATPSGKHADRNRRHRTAGWRGHRSGVSVRPQTREHQGAVGPIGMIRHSSKGRQHTALELGRGLQSGDRRAVPWFLLLALTDGLGEEPGWRGFLLPRQLEHVSIVYTWVFEHTNGSALSAIPLHAASNLCTMSASVTGGASWQLITLVLVSKWLLAAAVVLAWVHQGGHAVTHW
jgi:hypothetical protein